VSGPETAEAAEAGTADADALTLVVADFAAQLTKTVQAAFGPSIPPFIAKAAQDDLRARVAVSQQPSTGIRLKVNGVERMVLLVEFWLCWDHAQRYAAVDDARFKVIALGSGEPLFRYEYMRAPESGQPCAHLHVHAHRDAVTYLMAVAGDGSPRGKRRRQSINRKETLPAMRELHFPLGGHRFRPCLEDVLYMLLDEFGVDAQSGACEALALGRQQWRTHQLAASVRDSPQVAARVLQELGYAVAWPEEPEAQPADRVDRLQAY
jgi:hypothetical protein